MEWPWLCFRIRDISARKVRDAEGRGSCGSYDTKLISLAAQFDCSKTPFTQGTWLEIYNSSWPFSWLSSLFSTSAVVPCRVTDLFFHFSGSQEFQLLLKSWLHRILPLRAVNGPLVRINAH